MANNNHAFSIYCKDNYLSEGDVTQELRLKSPANIAFSKNQTNPSLLYNRVEFE